MLYLSFFLCIGAIYQEVSIHLRASRMLHFVPSSTCSLVNDVSGNGVSFAYLW
jgi:hypothetical protein